MSRIGKKPVPIVAGVKVSVAGRTLNVEGPVGKLNIELRPEVDVEVDADGKEATVTRKDDNRISKAMHGLNNMVIGCKEGYEKNLELQGVGYVCNLQGDTLKLRVGLANELVKKIPPGLDVTCPDQTHIKVKGPCKQTVGQFAAEVRALRKPEPYKGKGIRYLGEHVKIKPGKAAKQ